MVVESGFSVPDGVSFQEAIALTQSLLAHLEQDKVTEAELEQTISALVNSENGARGFFVTYLSDQYLLADALNSAMLRALQTAPDVISPLLVKNLVMSTAMAITHRRNHNESLAEGSDQVRSRTSYLIQALPLPKLQEQAQKMATSLETNSGDYQPFLQRWGYDTEQRQAMWQAIQQLSFNKE
jgi:hypothetical protein